jgi:hypothetical protein
MSLCVLKSQHVADTLDQDSDKMKTYDLARAEYWMLPALLFADSDELVFCPESEDLASQVRRD